LDNFFSSPTRQMESEADDLCRFMVSAAILLFFGMGVWMIRTRIIDERVFLVFDIVTVWLMVLLIFWLFVVERVLREKQQE